MKPYNERSPHLSSGSDTNIDTSNPRQHIDHQIPHTLNGEPHILQIPINNPEFL